MYSWADYAIVIVFVASALFGFWRGFVKEALSLVTWLVAIFLAWKFAWTVEPMLGEWIAAPELKLWAARVVILVLVLIAGGLLAWAVRAFIRVTGLSGPDRLLGALFGLARGALIVGLAVIGIQMAELDQDPWWQQARFRPLGDQLADAVRYYGSIGGQYLREQEIV